MKSHPRARETKFLSRERDGTWFLEWDMKCRWCSCRHCDHGGSGVLPLAHPIEILMVAHDQESAWRESGEDDAIEVANEWLRWGKESYAIAATAWGERGIDEQLRPGRDGV